MVPDAPMPSNKSKVRFKAQKYKYFVKIDVHSILFIPISRTIEVSLPEEGADDETFYETRKQLDVI